MDRIVFRLLPVSQVSLPAVDPDLLLTIPGSPGVTDRAPRLQPTVHGRSRGHPGAGADPLPKDAMDWPDTERGDCPAF